jgi:uncharacterized protein
MRLEFGNQVFEMVPKKLRFKAYLSRDWREKAGVDEYIPFQKEDKQKTETGINYAVVNVSQVCNVGKCLYCFASGGGFKRRQRLMTREIGQQTIEWLIRNSRAKNRIFYNFIGGEPLLNVPVINATIEYGHRKGEERNKSFDFYFSTNGTIFNKEVEELVLSKNLGINISCDGAQEVHNKLRGNTFSLLHKNIPRFIAMQPNTLIYSTLTSLNTDLQDYVELYRRWGCRFIKFGPVSMNHPGISLKSGKTLARLMTSYKLLAQKYLEDLINNDVYYIADFYRYISRLRNLKLMSRRCGAGEYYVNIDADGKIFICHRFTSDQRYFMGDVGSNPNITTELFGYPDVNLNRACQECDIRWICGGACLHDTWVLEGDIVSGTPDPFKCQLDRFLVSISMWLLVGLELYNPDALKMLERMSQLTLY